LIAENVRAITELELISQGSFYIPKNLRDIDFSQFVQQYVAKNNGRTSE
jgi:hypothetical protein